MNETKLTAILATHNQGKIAELKSLLSGSNWDVRDLSSAPGVTWEETGETFEENSLIKAKAVWEALTAEEKVTSYVIADDSGLCVDALGGSPGIFSSRYAGAHATDRDNYEKLLNKVASLPENHRSAHFYCSIVLLSNKGHKTFEGIMKGKISLAASGDHGFGYDPVFVPEGENITLASLPAEFKQAHSHRAQAVRKLSAYLLSTVDPD